ncbi:hypothetical protein VBJ04_11000 [Enterobacter hormaechei]|uniref:hypothetical protein n=1 Tax=Enterobacter cloacae complex TaxID=354276 RepID=UPI0007353C22|nr:hypothetical protein [Enterobacter hormaechei]CAE7078849.1 hypothetical protein AI2683V1_2041 [Enterobacter cloacae]EKV4773211.1 hypothetical protein [Enterobacter hormaechei]ELJ9633279.1 hypothetical protein [Enterobacter hormaechei]ELJ9636369.1 hypothetical protein [Enterobacter hormaechei]ELW9319245.1 hypothetical protein [Enterobacter hormaechei]
MKNVTDSALFSLLEWAVASLKKVENLPEQDCFELDLKVDLINIIRDCATAMNNPTFDEVEIMQDATDVAERLGELDEIFVEGLWEKM